MNTQPTQSLRFDRIRANAQPLHWLTNPTIAARPGPPPQMHRAARIANQRTVLIARHRILQNAHGRRRDTGRHIGGTRHEIGAFGCTHGILVVLGIDNLVGLAVGRTVMLEHMLRDARARTQDLRLGRLAVADVAFLRFRPDARDAQAQGVIVLRRCVRLVCGLREGGSDRCHDGHEDGEGGNAAHIAADVCDVM